MNGTEHYREAEHRLLMAWEEGRDPSNSAHLVAEAQVHATLALAAATALLGPLASEIEPYDNVHAWNKVAGVKTVPAAEPGQVDPEPAAPVRIDSLFGQVAQHGVMVSHDDWNGGKPVELLELRLRTDGIARIVYRATGAHDDVIAYRAADFPVTPA